MTMLEVLIPCRDRVPSPYQLTVPTLEAITQLSGQTMDPVHEAKIDSWVVVAFEIPDDVANCATRPGRKPLIKSRFYQAKKMLEGDGWIQRSEIPGKMKGHWCLTPKTLREVKNRLGGGGTGTLETRIARRRPQQLANPNQRADIEVINALISALGNSRKFRMKGITLPGGTTIDEILGE